MPSLPLRLASLLAGLAVTATVPAVAPRVTSPNGRAVLELRTGVQPNTGLLRTVVVTAGPIAQTTSLMVNTAFVKDVFGPNPPPMTWTVLVSSGTLFSLGGGCARGNQVDFPYINNNKLAIARFVGTTSTIITATINSAANYESVNCAVAPDRQSTLYVLVNSTAQRTEIWRQNVNNVFTLERQFVQPVRLPFNGGLRPSISRLLRATLPFPSNAKGAMAPSETDWFEPNKFMVIDQIASSTIRAQIWDPGTNSLHPSGAIAGNPASLPPVESVLASDCVVGDFNADGFNEVHAVGINHCGLTVNPTPAGNARGQNGYTYSAPGVYFAPATDTLFVYADTFTVAGGGVPAVGVPSGHDGTDGPFGLCHLAPSPRIESGFVALGPQPGDRTSLRFVYQEVPDPLAIFLGQGGFEEAFAPESDLNTVDCDPFDLRAR